MDAATTETAATPTAKPVIVKDTKNGITRPKDGTKVVKVWELADKVSADKGEPATRKEVVELATAAGLNAAMAASHYALWRKYHGLVGDKSPGRIVKPAAPAPAPATGEPVVEATA